VNEILNSLKEEEEKNEEELYCVRPNHKLGEMVQAGVSIDLANANGIKVGSEEEEEKE
jgi:hypothetical protein